MYAKPYDPNLVNSGLVESPKPHKLYNNLPFLIMDNGTLTDSVAFDYSWSSATASIDGELALLSTNSFRLSVGSETSAAASHHSEWMLSEARAEADAQAFGTANFQVYQAIGETDSFDLWVDWDIQVLQDDWVQCYYTDCLNNEWEIELLSSSGAIYQINTAPGLWDNLSFSGLSYQDSYMLNVFSRSWSQADSTAAIIYGGEVPGCEGCLEIIGYEYTYPVEYAAANVDVSVTVIGHQAQTNVPIPEPATMLLLGSGLVGLAGMRRKFKK
jgi:hypothetical protein